MCSDSTKLGKHTGLKEMGAFYCYDHKILPHEPPNNTFSSSFKCNRAIGSRSIGHRVWSMSLIQNTLTELSVN